MKAVAVVAAVLAGSGRLTIDRAKGEALELDLGGGGVISVGAVAVDRINLMLIGAGIGASIGVLTGAIQLSPKPENS